MSLFEPIVCEPILDCTLNGHIYFHISEEHGQFYLVSPIGAKVAQDSTPAGNCFISKSEFLAVWVSGGSCYARWPGATALHGNHHLCSEQHCPIPREINASLWSEIKEYLL